MTNFGIPRLSKHYMIVISYNIITPNVADSNTYFRNYAKINNNLLLSDVLSIPWYVMTSLSEPDDKVTFFNSHLVDLFERHVPVQPCTNSVVSCSVVQFLFSNATLTDTFLAIISIKSKAVGTDNIPPKFLEIILPHILPTYTKSLIQFSPLRNIQRNGKWPKLFLYQRF